MPRVKFKIVKPSTIQIENIRLASMSISPTDKNILDITDTTIETKSEIVVNTSNPLLHVIIRASIDSGGMAGLKWTFDITINDDHKTNPPEETFVNNNGIADFTQRYPY